MISGTVNISGNIIGGNTVTITPAVTVNDGIPSATIDYVRLYQNGQLTTTNDIIPNSSLTTGQT